MHSLIPNAPQDSNAKSFTIHTHTNRYNTHVYLHLVPSQCMCACTVCCSMCCRESLYTITGSSYTDICVLLSLGPSHAQLTGSSNKHAMLFNPAWVMQMSTRAANSSCSACGGRLLSPMHMTVMTPWHHDTMASITTLVWYPSAKSHYLRPLTACDIL